MTVKNNRCHELGVCQGLGADQCPDCDSWECNVLVEELYPQPGRRATDRAPLPTYPFAPGTIQGPRDTGMGIAVEDEGFWSMSWQRELVGVVVLVAVFGLAGTALVRWLV